MHRQKGFSLIELLIVVAIILIIAAIAIPNLTRSKMAANEASAVSSMRNIATAQVSYSTTYGGYSDDLVKLGPPPSGQAPTAAHADIIGWIQACSSQPCEKNGYNFSINNATGTPINAYTVNGVPTVLGSSGQRGFCTDQTHILTFDPAGGTACSSPIQ